MTTATTRFLSHTLLRASVNRQRRVADRNGVLLTDSSWPISNPENI